jgi:DNA processing protein
MSAYSVRELRQDEMPENLREIPEPPKRLFAAGTLPDPSWKRLAVVGSRKASGYGIEACERLIAGLTNQPIVIVSGLALGIDGIAHKAAMKAGLPTMAVPGSGLDPRVTYPATHRRLAEEIVEAGGCLISEYPNSFKATSWSFPRRNRIMAGLCDAILVIEAERKSGTLITARLGTEYNRTVLAVPGSIFTSGSTGTNFLLKLGATPALSSADILEALGMESEDEGQARENKYEDASPEELEIIGHLSSPMSRDALIELTGKQAQEIGALVSLMELKGYVKEELGEIFLS